MKLQSAIAQRITNLLNQSKMTKYALCKKVVISQSSLKRVIDGETNDIKLTTIERDEVRYMECLKNVKKCNMQDRINVVYQDALEVNLSGVAYDLIFIDAAKGQYTKFFEKYKYFLKPGGVIISDNLKFHGHVGNRENIANRNLKQLVGKIENYIDFLKENEEFETKFYDVGDGLSVSIRKNDI